MCHEWFKPVASEHFIRMQGEDKAQMTLAGTFMWALPRGRRNGRTNKWIVSGKKQTNKKHTSPITHSRLLVQKQVWPNDCPMSALVPTLNTVYHYTALWTSVKTVILKNNLHLFNVYMLPIQAFVGYIASRQFRFCQPQTKGTKGLFTLHATY